MRKKSINSNLLKPIINQKREQGLSDQIIHTQLSEEYFDKKSLALLISGTATIENRNRYKLYNSILVGLLGLIIVIKILTIVIVSFSTGTWWLLLLALLPLFLSGWFMYEISRFNAFVYRFCGVMTFFGFLKNMDKLETQTDLFIELIIVAAIVGLSFYLDKKLFPNYHPFSLKKDSNGDYLLKSANDEKQHEA